MTREIKFRAWDKKQNEMLQPFTTEDFFSESGMMNNSHDNCIFMQFTGLKDKNGKEIFEGDIVEYFQTLTQETTRVEVNFERIIGAKVSGYFVGEQGLEVIGNIYENPELIKN